MKGPVFTQAIQGPFDGQVLYVIDPRPGDTITVESLGEKAKYHVTGRMTPEYWEALYLDPDDPIWRVLKESRLTVLERDPLILREVPRQVYQRGDDGSNDSDRGALIHNILSLLPVGLLTSGHDHASGLSLEREQVGLCQVPTWKCGDYEAKPLQTRSEATASRSVAGLDSGEDVWYAGELGAFEGGWRMELALDRADRIGALGDLRPTYGRFDLAWRFNDEPWQNAEEN